MEKAKTEQEKKVYCPTGALKWNKVPIRYKYYNNAIFSVFCLCAISLLMWIRSLLKIFPSLDLLLSLELGIIASIGFFLFKLFEEYNEWKDVEYVMIPYPSNEITALKMFKGWFKEKKKTFKSINNFFILQGKSTKIIVERFDMEFNLSMNMFYKNDIPNTTAIFLKPRYFHPDLTEMKQLKLEVETFIEGLITKKDELVYDRELTSAEKQTFERDMKIMGRIWAGAILCIIYIGIMFFLLLTSYNILWLGLSLIGIVPLVIVGFYIQYKSRKLEIELYES